MAHQSVKRHHIGANGRSLMISIAVLMAGIYLAGCSPYPVYTASHRAPAEVDNRDAAEESDPGWSEPAQETTEVPDDNERMPIQPTIFSHVVEDYLGAPYRMGGHDSDGIDCSNLVRVLYRDYDGTRLPASTKRLYNLPRSVARDDLAVGDLVFFKFDGSNVSHVGVYLGDGRFVHSSQSQGVIISSLSDSAYRDRYAGARRVE